MLKGKKIAITGSSGFVGRHLVERVKLASARVIELDIAKGVDISKWDQIKSIEKFDLLYHLAAKTFVPDSFLKPRLFYQTNINCTINALELCRIHKAKLIFASSYVYGTPKYLPIDEKHPLSAFNPYAQSKIIGEQLCRSYQRDFGLPIIILRPFNIYGVGQNDNFLIPSIIRQAKTGKITLKDPCPRRDFINVSDAIEAYLKAALYDEQAFNVFNIGSGESISVLEIVNKIIPHFQHRVIVNFTGEKRKNEIMDTVSDITKGKEFLHWEPKIKIAEGIAHLFEHHSL